MELLYLIIAVLVWAVLTSGERPPPPRPRIRHPYDDTGTEIGPSDRHLG